MHMYYLVYMYMTCILCMHIIYLWGAEVIEGNMGRLAQIETVDNGNMYMYVSMHMRVYTCVYIYICVYV